MREYNLFQIGDFISHAGLPLKWKIECDAIKPEEWDALATMIMDFEKRPFSDVEGIPRGGVPLAKALKKYATGDISDRLLVVDDVYTTGTSFKEYCEVKYGSGTLIYKWCVFARKPPTDGINALFTMPEINDYVDTSKRFI